MKLHTLIIAALLGTMALAPAQSPSPDYQGQPNPKGSKEHSNREPAKDLKTNAEGSILLAPGRLVNVIAEIERRLPSWPLKPADGEWVMPNILYGKDLGDAGVPGAITLRGVSPLQALTLVAAASGCKLEPIRATEENDDQGNPAAIIGYRIALDKKPSWNVVPPPIGIPDKPVALESSSQVPETLKLPLGHPPIPDFADPTSDSKAKPLNLAPNIPVSADSFAIPSIKASDPNRQSVRIYALGSILSGSKDEIAAKEVFFQQLLQAALEKAGLEAGANSTPAPGSPGKSATSDGGISAPELSFHLELRALVAKGTAAQHEIIEQVMKALKENDKQSTPTTALPTLTAPVTPVAPTPLRAR